MKIKQNLSLRTKLMLAIILSQIIAVVLFAYPVIRGRYHIIEELLKELVLKSIHPLVSNLEEALSSSNLEALEQHLQRAVQNPEILYVIVEDPKGNVIASLSAKNAPPSLRTTEGTENTRTLEQFSRRGAYWNVVKPLLLGDALQGRVQVGVSTAEMENRIAETMRTTVKLVLLAMVIGSAIAVGLAWQLTKALNTLTRGVQRMAEGDLTHRVQMNTADELETLGKAFNHLMENLKASREELEQTHRAQMVQADRLASIGELASGVAHEIRNPLAGISGAIQVLAAEFHEESPKKQVIQEIQRQITRMNRTVQDILDYSRPAFPSIKLYNMNDLLDEVLFFLTTTHAMDKVKLEKYFDPFLPKTELDPKQMHQVCLNILLNAVQAMPQGGTLTIRTEMTEEEGKKWILVEIRDTGVGIPPEQQQRIFKPFFTTKPQGTGLGLAIALRIIEQHHGRITCRSYPGEGSSFFLWLPVAKEYVPKDAFLAGE